MLGVDISIDDEIIRQFDKLSNDLTDSINFGILGEKGRSLIIERTLAGVDVDGVQFVPYSKDYLQFKQERGGKHFSGKVDLNLDGNMLAAISSRSDKDSSEIFFIYDPKDNEDDDQTKARKHNQGFKPTNLPKREFFGLSDLDSDILGDLASRNLQDFINNL